MRRTDKENPGIRIAALLAIRPSFVQVGGSTGTGKAETTRTKKPEFAGGGPPCMRIMGGSGLGQGRQIIDSDGERGWIRTSDPRLKRSLTNGN